MSISSKSADRSFEQCKSITIILVWLSPSDKLGKRDTIGKQKARMPIRNHDVDGTLRLLVSDLRIEKSLFKVSLFAIKKKNFFFQYKSEILWLEFSFLLQIILHFIIFQITISISG